MERKAIVLIAASAALLSGCWTVESTGRVNGVQYTCQTEMKMLPGYARNDTKCVDASNGKEIDTPPNLVTTHFGYWGY
jgi:hypothetical protein